VEKKETTGRCRKRGGGVSKGKGKQKIQEGRFGCEGTRTQRKSHVDILSREVSPRGKDLVIAKRKGRKAKKP